MTPTRVVIIGAARSGTKMLRDALATATGAGAVPYDIGYVWRMGVEPTRSDVLEPDELSEHARSFITCFIDRYAGGVPLAVIEKTVGNTMRVPFVAAALPEARFVHLIRDGIDVAESDRRQWTAPTDWRYLAAKARHFPIRLAPRYGSRYGASLAGRLFRKDARVASWGPRYPGMDEDLRTQELLVVCARQWRESVTAANQSFQSLDIPPYEMRYEDFVSEPALALREVADSVGLSTTAGRAADAAALIRSDRLGSGRTALSAHELESLDSEIGKTLEDLGYARPVVMLGSEHVHAKGAGT